MLMSKNRMAYGLPDFVHPKTVCAGCLMSKQTRKIFPCQTYFHVTQVLQLVYGDLCGPISPSTTSGRNYFFFLLVDDFSKMMWIYFLASKDETLEVFKKFRAIVEKESSKEIKTFRTDRCGEFTSNNFYSYCESTSITRHLTVPYSPQQNRVVERRNRTVVAMARSFLKEKKTSRTTMGRSSTSFCLCVEQITYSIINREDAL